MTVQAATDGQRILVRFPYHVRLVDLIHKVPGARFHREDKTWHAPLTMDTCLVLRRVFGADLEVHRSLSVWARGELAREAELEAARNGQAASLDRVRTEAPDLYLAMKSRPYQLTGTSFITLGQNVLLGDQPGLGKTLQALAAVIETGAQDILVACPRTTTRTVWERETARWAPHIVTYVAQGDRKQREDMITSFATSAGSKMLIINPEMMRIKKGEPDEPVWPQLHRMTYDAVVMDESHQLLASTKNTMSKSITQGRYGAMSIRRRVRDGGLALAMSGTPFRSDLAKAWGTMNWLRPDVFTSFWNFAKTHFDVSDDGYSTVVGKEPLDPERFAAALRPYYLARDKQTAAPDLPPITYAGTPLPGGLIASARLGATDLTDDENYVQLDMEPEQAKAYETMRRLAEANIDGGKLTATGVLAEITRLRQFALSSGRLVTSNDEHTFQPALPSAKYDWILEFLTERQGNPGKVVIASNFTSWIKLISAQLSKDGFPNLMLTGETSDAGREDLVRLFQDPDSDLRIVIINTKAGGVGITLDAADDMIITDLPWKSDDERQLIDRIHRVSRIHNVTVYRLVSAGTVDVWMAGLTEKQRRILMATDSENRAKIAKEAVR